MDAVLALSVASLVVLACYLLLLFPFPSFLEDYVAEE